MMNNYFFCLLLSLNGIIAAGQLSPRDSVMLEKFLDVKLTDTLNTCLPYNIRLTTIEFLIKKELDPDEYYTVGKFTSLFGPALRYPKVGFLNILRINALRELDNAIQTNIGAAGGVNDDLWVLFDPDYKRILEIISSE